MRLEAAAKLVRQVEQVLDVALGVAQLLLGQRPGVPAREARRLGEPDPQHVVQEPAVARLGGEAGEPGGDLGVEDARELDAPLAAQDRDILAAGVDHDLHLGVGEHGGERLRVEARQRVQHPHLIADRHLDEAQQRPVPALGQELGVEPEPSGGARPLRESGDVVGRHR